MSAAYRLRFILQTTTLLALSSVPIVHSSTRTHLIHLVKSHPFLARTLRLAGYISVLLSLLLNLKSLPWSWQVRVLRAIAHALYLAPRAMRPADLFRPVVTTTWAAPAECDHNLHKSNSTYFLDLDVARAHLIGALIRTGLRRLNAGDTEGLPPPDAAISISTPATLDSAAATTETSGGGAGAGSTPPPPQQQQQPYIIALGAVACSFRKEIKPLARYEIWTRLLTWDDKWIYVVSHFVKPGTLRTQRHSLQPWRVSDGKGWRARVPAWLGGIGKVRQRSDASPSKREGPPTAAVYATAVAKYVCKRGRRTIAPEVLLRRSRLLPERLASSSSSSAMSAPEISRDSSSAAAPAAAAPETAPVAAVSHGLGLTGDHGSAVAAGESGDEPATAEAIEAGPTWDEIETMRLRGLKYAAMFDGLAGLHNDFNVESKDEEEVLGVYGEIFY